MQERELFKKYVKQGDVVYDIGANVGNTVKDFVALGASHVYAFEPSPNNYPKLLANTRRLPVSCFMVALNNKSYSCRTQFRDCSTDYRDSSGVTQDTEQQIDYVVLGDFIVENEIPDPDFIKMDIEGMESIVLTTLLPMFAKRRPIALVEIHAAPRGNCVQNYAHNPHWTWPEDGGFDFNLLKDLNYRLITDDGELARGEDWNPRENTHRQIALLPE